MSNATRLYAYGKNIDDEDYHKWLSNTEKIIEGSPVQIVPESEANLVLSLCDDGYHRPALDIDYPCEISEVFGAQTLHVDMRFPSEYGYYWAEKGIQAVDLSRFGAVELVPSSTEGHFHLYGDHRMTWGEYYKTLHGLRGIIGSRYLQLSVERGFTALRKPGVKKPAPVRKPNPTIEISVGNIEFPEVAA